MQTFLPYSDFTLCSHTLDRDRCWKQVVQARCILDILLGRKIIKNWKNHPAVRMWYSYEPALQQYYNTFYDFSVSHHGIKPKKLFREEITSNIVLPAWLGYPPLHYSHQSNLYRKALDDSNGINSMGNSKRSSSTLLKHLEKLNLTNIDYMLKYVWPIDMRGNLIPEIKDWLIQGSNTNAERFKAMS